MSVSTNRFHNGGFENCVLKVDVPSLPLDVQEALPEVETKDLIDKRFNYAFPVHPHYTFECIRSGKIPLVVMSCQLCQEMMCETHNSQYFCLLHCSMTNAYFNFVAFLFLISILVPRFKTSLSNQLWLKFISRYRLKCKAAWILAVRGIIVTIVI